MITEILSPVSDAMAGDEELEIERLENPRETWIDVTPIRLGPNDRLYKILQQEFDSIEQMILSEGNSWTTLSSFQVVTVDRQTVLISNWLVPYGDE